MTHSADSDKVIYRVEYRKPDRRDAFFVVRGKPKTKGRPDLLEKALNQFFKSVRFVYLRSGESLRDFLSSTFRELLHTVLQEHLSAEYKKAEEIRNEYIKELRSTILNPLSEHLFDRLSEVMDEIESLSVEPFISALEETISMADIQIKDSAETTIVNKGTGLRACTKRLA